MRPSAAAPIGFAIGFAVTIVALLLLNARGREETADPPEQPARRGLDEFINSIRSEAPLAQGEEALELEELCLALRMEALLAEKRALEAEVERRRANAAAEPGTTR